MTEPDAATLGGGFDDEAGEQAVDCRSAADGRPLLNGKAFGRQRVLSGRLLAGCPPSWLTCYGA